MTTATDEEVLDVREAAALMRMSTRKLNELALAGALPSAKFGGRRLFRRSALLAALEEMERRARAQLEAKRREVESARETSKRVTDAAREAAREAAAKRGITIVGRR
jgi:excisionase family DNA binding protein